MRPFALVRWRRQQPGRYREERLGVPNGCSTGCEAVAGGCFFDGRGRGSARGRIFAVASRGFQPLRRRRHCAESCAESCKSARGRHEGGICRRHCCLCRSAGAATAVYTAKAGGGGSQERVASVIRELFRAMCSSALRGRRGWALHKNGGGRRCSNGRRGEAGGWWSGAQQLQPLTML